MDWDRQLILSARDGNLNMVKEAIENGADVHARNDMALVSSAIYNHLDVVRYLVEHGGDVRARNNMALILSATAGHLDVVRYLVEGPFPEGVIGANIYVDNNLALRESAVNGHLDVANYLLRKGANPDAIPIERLRDIRSKFGHYNLATLAHKKMIDEGIEHPVEMPKLIWAITEPTSRSLKGRIIRLLKEDLQPRDRSILLSLL